MKRGEVYFLMLLVVVLASSCYKVTIPDNVSFKNKLSDYNIYSGNVSDLTPKSGYFLYEVSAELYSNNAEKHRLIKLPVGTEISNSTNELPEFPNGTIIVKTFYYFIDKRDTSLGKNIIETRLLIKKDNLWNVAAYEWNANQTDAVLTQEGSIKSVEWINEEGETTVLSYEIPDQEKCAICHQVEENVKPIGVNLRYLNFDVERNGVIVNQLEYLQNEGLLNVFAHSEISLIPNYYDTTLSLEKRARAYLDANCGYCHKSGGYVPAANRVYDFAFDTELTKSRIDDYRKLILQDMEKGKMPMYGNSVVDEKGIELVRSYLNTL